MKKKNKENRKKNHDIEKLLCMAIAVGRCQIVATTEYTEMSTILCMHEFFNVLIEDLVHANLA
jgi:hypothetical protein